VKLRVAKKVVATMERANPGIAAIEAAFRRLRRGYRHESRLLHYPSLRSPPQFLVQYVIEGGRPVPARDTVDWCLFFEAPSNRRVRSTRLPGVWVSTVFLGLDHGFGRGAPVLWETMVFVEKDLPWDEIHEQQRRYSSRRAAVEGHDETVQLVRGWLAARPVQA
jgi:hypothetical protein